MAAAFAALLLGAALCEAEAPGLGATRPEESSRLHSSRSESQTGGEPVVWSELAGTALEGEGDPLFQRHYPAGAGAASWLRVASSEGIIYVALPSPPRIERFEVATSAWLPTIGLAEEPTAFFVDADGMYISFGRRTSHFTLDGGVETHLRNTNGDANGLIAAGSVLAILASSEVRSVDKLSGTLLDEEDYTFGMRGFSFSSSAQKIFAHRFASPTDIVHITLGPGGELGPQVDSPYHGDFPGSEQTYVLPGKDTVTDTSGIVYSTDSLVYGGSLAGNFLDLAHDGSDTYLLRAGRIDRHGPNFLRTGSLELSAMPLDIEVHGDTIFTLADEPGGGLALEAIAIDSIPPLAAEPAVDPAGLEYDPSWIHLASDGLIYLLASDHANVFRWSMRDGAYLESISLLGEATHLAYSSTSERLYLAYSNGEITMIDLESQEGAGPAAETLFVNSPQSPCGLAVAGEFLFVCDPSGAWVSHFTYSPTGELLSQEDFNYPSAEFVWNAALRKMFHTRDGTGPNDILWEDIDEFGVIGAQMDSPAHGGLGQLHPIRVTESGSWVVIGSGRLLDAVTLKEFDTLSNNIDDGFWWGDVLFTMRAHSGVTQLQRWEEPANWGVTASAYLPGQPLKLLWDGQEAIAITSRGGKPSFATWDFDLVGSSLLVAKSDTLDSAEPGSEITYVISVANPSAGSVEVLVEDRLPSTLQAATWTCQATEGSSCAEGIQGGDILDSATLDAGGTLLYLVTGRIAMAAQLPLVNTVTASSVLGVSTASDLTSIDLTTDLVVFYDGFESGDTSGWSSVVP